MFYCKITADYSKGLIIIAKIIVTCFLPQVESIFTESRFAPEAQSQSTGKWKYLLFNTMNSQHLLLANNGYETPNLKN